MRNRREFVRVRPHPDRPVEVQLMGRTRDDAGAAEESAQTFLDVLPCDDVGEGGVRVRVEHDFDGCRLDDLVTLIVALPGLRAFSAKAHVRHLGAVQATHVFGVAFVGLDDRHRRLLQRYVDEMVACGRGG